LLWIDREPAFANQAYYVDNRVDTPEGYINATSSLPQLANQGFKIVAPVFCALTKLDEQGNIVPS